MKKISVVVLALLALMALGLPNFTSDTAQAGLPPPPIEDVFPETSLTVTVSIPLLGDITGTGVGTTTIHTFTDAAGSASDTDGDLLDQVATEIVAMEIISEQLLIGISSLLASTGEIEETSNTTPGRRDVPPFAPSGSADSFFDIFVEVELTGLPGLTAHNEAPIRLQAVV